MVNYDCSAPLLDIHRRHVPAITGFANMAEHLRVLLMDDTSKPPPRRDALMPPGPCVPTPSPQPTGEDARV